MRFTPALTVLLTFAANLVAQVSATPTPVKDDDTMSESQLLTWLSTTDAELTYIGAPVGSPHALVGGNVMVVYCNKRTQGVCGGACTVYNGGATCLNAPGTTCLRATASVGFCDKSGCSGSCNQFSSCGTRLNDGFCFTPGTKSIIVPFV
ncbi:hypothetical protein AURDEDRAFT_139067 [Auricularia subglabra TFB-10046 SS5]|nr:hypothetical protein AURDEDRAFT_139067 [Auricularia subglabra TFB-10046 SS5]